MKEVLRAFLDHRRDVLLRRSRFRLEKIDARLEILEGLLVAYFNLDRVIEIIRTEDDPKAVMIAEFHLSDVQAEAILNMRLRNLRKLEEMEIRAERDALTEERSGLMALLGDEEMQWSRIADELREVRKAFGKSAPGGARRTEFADAPELEEISLEAMIEREGLVALLADEGAQWSRIAEEIREVRKAFGKDAKGGARRTSFDDAPEVQEVPLDSMIEREPVTVVCSEMGWIRAMKGHLDPSAELKFKDGDGPRFFLHAETTDRILLFASNGRMYTLACATLPGGRGMGEPVRLMIDLPNEAQLVALFVHVPGAKLLLASEAGDGFVLPEDEAVAQTRAGRQILNVREGTRAVVCRPVAGDHIAVVGNNRKLLVFPRSELPEMGRGKGVRLQRYKDKEGRLVDAVTFDLADGLAWKDPAGRTRTVTELADWTGARATAGRMAPRGFPASNRFD